MKLKNFTVEKYTTWPDEAGHKDDLVQALINYDGHKIWVMAVDLEK